MKIRYGYRYHRGGLKESLETTKYIDRITFKSLINDYEYYAFDERINQIVFITKNLPKSVLENKPQWLFIEISQSTDDADDD